MSLNSRQPSCDDLSILVGRFLSGDESCADSLCICLKPKLFATTARFFKVGSFDAEDVVQESLVVALDYLRRRGEFEGDFQKFCNTLAANRCRDILRRRKRFSGEPLNIDSFQDWVADPSRSALDLLMEDDIYSLLQKCLDQLSKTCRDLLKKLFLLGQSVEKIRKESGVSTVQAIYYRRTQCLNQAQIFFKKALGRSSI